MSKLSKAGAVTMAGVLVCALAVAASYPAVLRAFNPQPDPPGIQKFPPLDVTAAVNVRLNVANTKFFGESSEQPCAAVLFIFDSEGHVLARDRKLLRARETAFIDVTGSEILSGRAGPRAQIWAAVAAGQSPQCPMNASLELVDSVSSQTLTALGVPRISQ